MPVSNKECFTFIHMYTSGGLMVVCKYWNVLTYLPILYVDGDMLKLKYAKRIEHVYQGPL